MPLTPLPQRAVLRLSGPDTRDFLQGLLTQDVAALSAETPLYAGLLSPQGKTLFQLFLFADGADVLLDVAASGAEALAKRLTMFRLRKQVQIAPAPGLAVWQKWAEDSPHPADPRDAQAGSRFLAPAGEAGALDAWHAHRLALGLPEADEIGTDDLLWLETNARELHGVSFTKGCYSGQENTARMHHRDKLRKRLLPVRLSGASGTDAKVMAGDREAGQLRGVRHGGMQMALFRMDYADQPLTVDGVEAQLVRPDWLQAEG
jgi:folate-binding protein YgfZ